MLIASLSNLFNDAGGNLRNKVTGIYTLLFAANIAAWGWALVALKDFPILLGTAVLAYSFGLRHALDVDHIAAIDNVTRKLMQEEKQPVAVGLFFSLGHSLGHSTVVFALTVAIAITATTLQTQFESFKTVGGVVGTLVSAFFLFVIALANIIVLFSVY
jgi:high-affinity nickel-transport protein